MLLFIFRLGYDIISLGDYMRLRNVKDAKTIIASSKYIIEKPINYKNTYQKLFDNNNPVYIEIGTGKGQFIVDNALKYPNINFIGIEKFDSVMVRVTQRLESLDIPNLKLICVDALLVDDIFDHEIDLIYLNFSDPWPKKRHTNRRLTSPLFLEKYDKIFKNKAHIIIKTDNRGLFEYSLKSLTDYGYKINDVSLDLYNSDIKDNIPTEYEKRFHQNGNLIYRLDVLKD